LVNELYQQIGQLTVERDWLKKKSELFKRWGEAEMVDQEDKALVFVSNANSLSCHGPIIITSQRLSPENLKMRWLMNYMSILITEQGMSKALRSWVTAGRKGVRSYGVLGLCAIYPKITDQA
jgi:hypothetical protein